MVFIHRGTFIAVSYLHSFCPSKTKMARKKIDAMPTLSALSNTNKSADGQKYPPPVGHNEQPKPGAESPHDQTDQTSNKRGRR